MTITATPETVRQQQESKTPAQAALATAVTLSLSAQAAAQPLSLEWMYGHLARSDYIAAMAGKITGAMAQALAVGGWWGAQEMQAEVQPLLLTDAEQVRLEGALDTIAPTIADRDGIAEVIMRSARLARAEVVTAGRRGYADAILQAIVGEPGWVWRFETSARPCSRCVLLAAQTFATHTDAPISGAHPGCECVLTAQLEDR